MSTDTLAAASRTKAAEQTITARPADKVPSRLRKVLALSDFERAAKRHLPRSIYVYISGTAEEGGAAAATREAFHELEYVSRVLRDVSARDQSAALFGKSYASPFGISPMGSSALAAFQGDLVLAEGAAKSRIPSIMSAASLMKLEDIAAAAPGRWFQAYLPGDTRRIEALVDRVAEAGFDAFVVTVDVPVAGNREHYIRVGFDAPLKPSLSLAWQGISRPSWLFNTALRTLLRSGMPHFENMDAVRGPPILSRNLIRNIGNRDQFSWDHIDIIRRRWKGKLVVKGVLAGEDARIASDHGVDGVIVSSHGGRQLDYAIAPLRALSAVVANAGNMAVMLDGGIRRGTDVLKALALGAHFVFVGRPFLFAAAVYGEDGVRHCARLLTDEIDRDMAMLGIRSLAELNASFLAEPRHSLQAAAPSRG